MLVNHPQASGGPFLPAFSGAFWRTGQALAGAGQGKVSVLTSRTVLRPLALPNTLAWALCLAAARGAKRLDSRVVSVPAGRKSAVRIESSDRTRDEPNRIELLIAMSNRHEGRR